MDTAVSIKKGSVRLGDQLGVRKKERGKNDFEVSGLREEVSFMEIIKKEEHVQRQNWMDLGHI